jgi:calcineurin-like phosphoesterase family protein
MSMDTVYVTADTHFNHRSIIDYTGRPYASVAEMNEAIVETWNSVIPPKADVWFLGDFGFAEKRGGEPVEDIFARLNGHKHLVKGNHDEANSAVLRLPWESIHDLVTIRRDGLRAVACHYPLTTWKHAHRGWKMLHGHSHGTLRDVRPGRLDVGWDVHERPLTLHEAVDLCSDYYDPVDHHAA